MKTRILTALIAVFFILPFFSMTALAAPDDTPDETVITEAAPDMPESESGPVTGGYDPEAPAAPSANPFTPSGTGTVIDTATDADGKVFYTITTPDEHVFYLVIDRQRGQENVCFLNAVTIADLAALAEIPAQPDAPTAGTVTTPPTTAAPEAPAEETPPPAEKEQGGGNMGMMIFIAVIVVLGGGAGWYFKIYRPKQQGAASGDEYEPPVADDENDLPGDWDDEISSQDEDGDEADDSPPWDEEESVDGE